MLWVRLDHKEVFVIKNIVPVVLFSCLPVLSLNRNDLSSSDEVAGGINVRTKSMILQKSTTSWLPQSYTELIECTPKFVLFSIGIFVFPICFLFASNLSTMIYGLAVDTQYLELTLVDERNYLNSIHDLHELSSIHFPWSILFVKWDNLVLFGIPDSEIPPKIPSGWLKAKNFQREMKKGPFKTHEKETCFSTDHYSQSNPWKTSIHALFYLWVHKAFEKRSGCRCEARNVTIGISSEIVTLPATTGIHHWG